MAVLRKSYGSTQGAAALMLAIKKTLLQISRLTSHLKPCLSILPSTVPSIVNLILAGQMCFVALSVKTGDRLTPQHALIPPNPAAPPAKRFSPRQSRHCKTTPLRCGKMAMKCYMLLLGSDPKSLRENAWSSETKTDLERCLYAIVIG